jgi:hypothetical protein
MTDEQKRQYLEQKQVKDLTKKLIKLKQIFIYIRFYKLQDLYNTMMTKRAEVQSLASKIKKKHEYDSDEEIDDDGTWEHKLRSKTSFVIVFKADFFLFFLIMKYFRTLKGLKLKRLKV